MKKIFVILTLTLFASAIISSCAPPLPVGPRIPRPHIPIPHIPIPHIPLPRLPLPPMP